MTDLVVVTAGFAGQITAVVVASYLSQRSAAKARIALINAATQAKVDLADIKSIADTTHTIVNSQRTMMLRLIAELTRRIARENPTDKRAQQQAKLATSEAKKAGATI